MQYQVYDGDGWRPIKSHSKLEVQQQAGLVYFGTTEIEWEEEPRQSPEEARSWVCDHDGITIYVVELTS